ncbi:MAG TPA: MAPEG family protein [Woeseiaceae bacterium]|nr:MAPEG family protein [Woeseiaceae bacterium]
MLQSPAGLYLAMLAQVLLTMVVYVALARAKGRALRAGQVDRARARLHDDAWPDDVIQINNNIDNQFQVPVLFYVVCFILAATNATGLLVLALAWLFVATRVAHAWIHTHSNYVPLRRNVFMAGCVIVVALWVLAVVRVL